MTEAKVLIWHSLSHLTLLTVRLDRVPVKALLYKSTNFYVSQTCAFISRKVMKDVFLILTAQIKFLFELKKKKTVEEQNFVIVEIQGRQSNIKALSS